MEQYISRLAEKRFLEISNFFQVSLVCGPRQCGKTTMLKHLCEKQNRTYVTMDDIDVRQLAINDPKLFFQRFKTPILIDEIQKAPSLFEQIKIMADENKKAGEFWLTGSASFEIMKKVTESLAGRIGILNMYSMTLQEVNELSYGAVTDFSLDNLMLNERTKPLELNDVFEYIFMGGMPKLVSGNNENIRSAYFSSYISSYIMRDVVEEGGVANIVKFNLFLSACASQVGNVVNYVNLASVCDISEPTAKQWLKVLQGMGIVYLLQPYFNNTLKRLTKTPKLYFYDTGLCAYLAKIPTAETLAVSSFAGNYFENFVVNEIVKKYALLDNAPNVFYYRDVDKNEVDVLLEFFDGLIPLEIKLTASPNFRDVGKFAVLEKLNKPIKNGGILCLAPKVLPINDKNSIVPVSLI